MSEEQHELGARLEEKKAEVECNLRQRRIPAADIPDLLQETFRRTIEHVRESGNEGELGPLLQTISDRVAKNYKARAKTRADKAEKITFSDLAPSNPEKEASQQEINAELRATLSDLPSDVQEILELKLIEDQPNAEIARALGISESTVKRRIAQYLSACQTALRKRGINNAAALSALFAMDRFQKERSGLDDTNPGLTLESPAKAPPSATNGQATPRAWDPKSVIAGAAGILLLLTPVFLLREERRLIPSSPSSSEAPIVALGAPREVTQADVAQDGRPPDCPVCSDSPAPPAPPMPPCKKSPTTGSQAKEEEPEIDSSNRDMARICRGSILRKNKAEAKFWCSKVQGPLRDALQPLIRKSRIFAD